MKSILPDGGLGIQHGKLSQYINSSYDHNGTCDGLTCDDELKLDSQGTYATGVFGDPSCGVACLGLRACSVHYSRVLRDFAVSPRTPRLLRLFRLGRLSLSFMILSNFST